MAIVDAGRSHRVCQSCIGYDAVASFRHRSRRGDGEADSAAADAITGRRSAAARIAGWTTTGVCLESRQRRRRLRHLVDAAVRQEHAGWSGWPRSGASLRAAHGIWRTSGVVAGRHAASLLRGPRRTGIDVGGWCRPADRFRCGSEPASGAARAGVAAWRNDRMVARRADAGDWWDSRTRAVLQRQPWTGSIRASRALQPRSSLSVVDGTCATHGGRGRTRSAFADRPVARCADAHLRQRVEHVEAALLRLGQRLGTVGGAARRVPFTRRAVAHASGPRGGRRSDGGAAAAGQAGGELIASSRRLSASACVRGRSWRTRTGWQHRRCRDSGVVRVGCCRARCVGHRRWWTSGSVSQRHVRADRDWVQGSDAALCDARRAGAAAQRASAQWRTDVGQHPGRRGWTRLSLHEVQQQACELGRSHRASDQICRWGVRARRDASVERRRRTAVVSEVHRLVTDLSGERACPPCGWTVPQPRLCNDVEDDCQWGCAGVLSRLDREADCGRHVGERRADHGSRPGAVSRDRAQAGVRPLSRPRSIYRWPAGERRREPPRGAADSRQLRPAPARDGWARRRLPALSDRVVEGARSDRAYRGPGAVGGRLRRAPATVACRGSVRAHSSRQRSAVLGGLRGSRRRSGAHR